MRVSDIDNYDDDIYEGQQLNRAERTRIRREREIKRQLVWRTQELVDKIQNPRSSGVFYVFEASKLFLKLCADRLKFVRPITHIFQNFVSLLSLLLVCLPITLLV